LNKKLLNTDIQDFINKNLNTDIASVLFKNTPIDQVTIKEIAQQIEAKKKCQTKLPTWFNTPNIYYPHKLSIEQTSSEISAQYKASLIQGESIIDLTGGFGVDSFYFSKKFTKVIHCEIKKELSEIVLYNNQILQIKNIQIVADDGINFLKKVAQKFDYIFIDPSRRNDKKGKVFMLSDCLPNVPENLNTFFKSSNKILIKTSPILDISVGLKELPFVKEIHIVSIKNEVKELVWFLEKGFTNSVIIKTSNLLKQKDQKFNFAFEDERNTTAAYSLPQSYLYEPNVAILKSGAFNLISKKLNVYKLHPHSHLYTNDDLIDFPGRVFKIIDSIKYQKKNLKILLRNTKASVISRNFPESVDQIRKQFKIKEGSTLFYFFTTNRDNVKIVIIGKKIVDITTKVIS